MDSTQGKPVGQTTLVSTLSGWVTFAGVMAAIVGLWNIFSGIAAIAEDDHTEALVSVLYGIDISAWGWFWLVTGVVQAITAWLIFVRHPVGQVLGVLLAALSAAFAVFAIFVAPLWALAVLAIDVAIIGVLVVHTDEFVTD